MEKMKFAVPCLFGLEGLVADELKNLGYETMATDGRVFFEGDSFAIARANVNLRYGERVLFVVGEFEAYSFDDLFERTKALPWEEILPGDAKFPVKGHSLNSKLYSVPDCQAIIKKAVVERIKIRYQKEYFEETGPLYQISFSILKDKVAVMIDTSGEGLFKRGYRAKGNEAPIRETLAAAMVKLSKFKFSEYLLDPFCGSGTILIEAALLATNTAPGMNRHFSFENFATITKKGDLAAAIDEAKARVRPGNFLVHGIDLDPKAVALARENARLAGVADLVEVKEGDATRLSLSQKGGVIVTNPPYGERLMTPDMAREMYQKMGKSFLALEGFRYFIISSDTEFERYFGRRADKKRKLYNGMIKCELFQYFKR